MSKLANFDQVIYPQENYKKAQIRFAVLRIATQEVLDVKITSNLGKFDEVTIEVPALELRAPDFLGCNQPLEIAVH